jgi:hypothetical protein
MNPLTEFKKILILPILIALALVAPASATLPPGNTVEQWNKIAEDTVVGSGTFQPEGFIYMAYPSAAVYDAVVAIEGGFEPYGPPITAPPGASVDCAVVEAAYRTLRYYFSSSPGLVANLDAYYAEALFNFGGCTADGGAGTAVGLQAANDIIALRTGDGRMTPIVPDATAGSGRVAPHAAIRGAADAVGGGRAPICLAEPGPVPAGPAALASEPRVGRGLQPD